MKPNTGSSMQDKSASQHPAIQRTGRPKRRRWLLLLVLFLIAAGAVVLVASIKGNAGAGTTSGGTFTARRDNLVITVSEGGSIRAHKSIEYRCEVESRGAQITILSIVPSGAYISQKDVEEGMVLVKLDSSSLEDQLIQEKMELASDQENETSAKEAYDIQVIQNESDVADGRLQVRFALLDLQKYLGAVLAERLTRDVNDAVDLTEYVAPFLVEVRDDPNLLDGTAAGQELKRLNDDIVLAEGNLKTAQARLAGTEKLHDANYVSELDLQGDRLTVVNREFAEQNAKVNLDLFLRYDFPKNAEQSLSDYIEAGRKLERTFAECRSRLAQAQAKLANAQTKGTGFSEEDLALLWEALVNMFEHDHSAARGKMASRRLIVFKHASDLGNAPSHLLFERVKVDRKAGVVVPRNFSDYTVTVDKHNLPEGVEIIEKLLPWNTRPTRGCRCRASSTSCSAAGSGR